MWDDKKLMPGINLLGTGKDARGAWDNKSVVSGLFLGSPGFTISAFTVHSTIGFTSIIQVSFTTKLVYHTYPCCCLTQTIMLRALQQMVEWTIARVWLVLMQMGKEKENTSFGEKGKKWRRVKGLKALFRCFVFVLSLFSTRCAFFPPIVVFLIFFPFLLSRPHYLSSLLKALAVFPSI